MTLNNGRTLGQIGGALVALLAPLAASAQTPDDEEEVFELSPFEVVGSEQTGYATARTLAGNRLSTDIKDLGTSLSIYNETFFEDVGATDNQSLLKYTLGTEVGGINGNYSGTGGGTAPNADAAYLSPQSTNRVRGLVSADNTRDLYLSSIPWDGYNVDAVDLQRGPNAILFGQGSPGGVINARTNQAAYDNFGELSLRVDEYGSLRGTVDLNREILDNELAIRLNAVEAANRFKQEEAYEDFNRQYLALRYEPKFMKRGEARTIIRGNYEMGSSHSNRPRNLPPLDYITPWFQFGQPLYNTAWLNENHLDIPGRGDALSNGIINGVESQPNPDYNPWLNTNFGNNYFGGSEFFYLPGQTTPALGLAINPYQYGGLNQLGEQDNNIGGLAPSQPRGIRGYRDWAIETGQPFATLAKNKYITDTSIFDFYNHLIDGDVKEEWANFDAYDIALSQTFFGDTMGFDIGYHNETYTGGSYSPLIGNGGAIFLDYNAVWPDGTNSASGWYTDGTANPGAGRPFVQLGNGKGETTTERESYRATAFVSHDFEKGTDNWLLRLLGNHTVTGMTSRDTRNDFARNWAGSTFVGDYYNNPMFDQIKADNGRFWADFVPIRTAYIGDSLVGKSLGDNFNLRGPVGDPQLEDNVMLRYFDPTWLHPTDPEDPNYVDPGAPWTNYVTAAGGAPSASYQAENPQNYRGWVTEEVQLLRDTSAANRELLTNRKVWTDQYNDAYAFVWQGKFWDDSIIGTAGWRHDEVGQTRTEWNREEAIYDIASVPFIDSELGPFERDSKSWGVVAHLNSIPGLSKLLEKSPINISLSYNKSDNFQTGQPATDYFGQALPLPRGETKDFGLLLASKDGRYSLKLNKFESVVENNLSSGLEWWRYGNNVGIMAAAYRQYKFNLEGRSATAVRHGDNIISDTPYSTPENPTNKVAYDYLPVGNQTREEASQLEIAVVNAWDQWLEEMAPLPQTMAVSWGFDYEDDFTETGLDSFRFTEELVAEGYEAEFNAQIRDNWRLTVNATRIESTRDNIGNVPAPGGEMTMMEYMLDFDRRLSETAMGDLRIWGGDGTDTARSNWSEYADGDLKARLAEQGTVVPENRLWRVNMVTNYDFREGALQGWSVGGGARYQSEATLAYTPIQGDGFISYDLDAPYRDDAQIDVDLWVGYNRRVWNDAVDWKIQINVSNVGVGEELIPVTVQPDGTPAAYRIRPPQQIFMTNTFSF